MTNSSPNYVSLVDKWKRANAWYSGLGNLSERSVYCQLRDEIRDKKNIGIVSHHLNYICVNSAIADSLFCLKMWHRIKRLRRIHSIDWIWKDNLIFVAWPCVEYAYTMCENIFICALYRCRNKEGDKIKKLGRN